MALAPLLVALAQALAPRKLLLFGRLSGMIKVIIEKSRGEVSPMGQDTIENVS